MKNIRLLLTTLLLLSSIASKAQQIQRLWTGGGNTNDWGNAANWQNNTIPGPNDIAYFNGTSTKNCTINQSTIIYGLKLDNGYTGIISQANGVKFFIGPSGAILNAGSLILGSDTCKIWGVLNTSGGGTLDAENNYFIVPEASETFELAQARFCNTGMPLAENQNYVRTQTIFVPVQQENLTLNLTTGDQLISTNYYDGLGRPLQTVARQISPLKKDMVMLHDYDEHGRETKNYLPYAADDCNGQFKPMDRNLSGNAFSKQQDFYTLNPDPLIAKTNLNGQSAVTYAERVFENSPLGRVLEQGMAGESWKVQSGGSGHTAKQIMRLNTTNEVLYWKYNYTTGNATSGSNTGFNYYPANSLSVLQGTDENGNLSFLYLDKQGRLLLKKQQLTVTEYIQTYYVYDSKGQLRFVIPPKATDLIITTSQVTINSGNTFSDPSYLGYQLLFAYKYDGRGRITEKKLPGAGRVKIIYDFLDRPVLTQDSVQRESNQWNFIKYDALGRTILTGLYTDASSDSLLRALVHAHPYLYEKKFSGQPEKYTRNAFPTTNFTVHNISYYDNYNFDAAGGDDYNYLNAGLGAQEPIVYTNSQGLLTGTRTKNLETQDLLFFQIFYDKYNQPIQTQSNNNLELAIADISTVIYDFAGRVIQTKEIHTALAATHTIAQRIEYDHASRPTKLYHKINAQTEINITQYQYNELGQTVEKNLHNTVSGGGQSSSLQSLDYRYNIRGWLTSLNNSTLSNDNGTTNNDANDLFGIELAYEQIFSGLNNSSLYNGNITAVKWSTNNTATAFTSKDQRAYTYSYDKLYRLTGTDYYEKTYLPHSFWIGNNSHSEKGITYDLNGNILSLNRTGANATIMDDLSYTYEGNRLKKVADLGAAAEGFKEGADQNTEYTYDGNGNLKTDLNKGITNITYNHLHLVTSLSYTKGADNYQISYTYNGLGEKLSRKTYKNTLATEERHYIGGYEYSSATTLEFLQTPEGRATIKTDGTFLYEYFLTDHQGNVRIAFADLDDDGVADPLQESHYYAFGMVHQGDWHAPSSSTNKYLYNAKEYQEGTELYDYGFRQYDAALGRWHVQDAMAEKYYDFTPYHYVLNNPVNLIDLLGLEVNPLGEESDPDAEEYFKNGEIVEEDEVVVTPTSKDEARFAEGIRYSDEVLSAFLNSGKKEGQIKEDVSNYSDDFKRYLSYQLAWRNSSNGLEEFGDLMQFMTEILAGFAVGPEAGAGRVLLEESVVNLSDDATKVVINQTVKNLSDDAAKATIEILAKDKSGAIQYLAKYQDEAFNVIVESIEKNGDDLILNSVDITGSEAGKITVKGLYEVARQLGKQEGVSRVIINGNIRNAGKFSGQFPSQVIINVP